VLSQRLLAATSRDTVRTKALTGKPVRMLRNEWFRAWESPEAPKPLSSPQQGLLVRPAMSAALEQHSEAALSTPIGQVVGQMTELRDAREAFQELVDGCDATLTRLRSLVNHEPRP
jgi:NAD(P)H-dependent flavin oxidoreductase YrpB (nitropropane dioxygenase family)